MDDLPLRLHEDLVLTEEEHSDVFIATIEMENIVYKGEYCLLGLLVFYQVTQSEIVQNVMRKILHLKGSL